MQLMVLMQPLVLSIEIVSKNKKRNVKKKMSSCCLLEETWRSVSAQILSLRLLPRKSSFSILFHAMTCAYTDVEALLSTPNGFVLVLDKPHFQRVPSSLFSIALFSFLSIRSFRFSVGDFPIRTFLTKTLHIDLLTRIYYCLDGGKIFEKPSGARGAAAAAHKGRG